MDPSIELTSFAERSAPAARWSGSRPCAGSVAVLSHAPRHAELVDALTAAVERLPRLRQRPVKQHGRQLKEWRDDPGFEVEFHLRWETFQGDQDLLAVATQRFFRPFARQAPPWELHVLEGTTRSLVLVRLDPAFDDGELGAALLASLCAESEPEHAEAVEPLRDESSHPAIAVLATLEAMLPRVAALRDSAIALICRASWRARPCTPDRCATPPAGRAS